MQFSSCDSFRGLGHWEATDAVPSQLLLRARNRLLPKKLFVIHGPRRWWLTGTGFVLLPALQTQVSEGRGLIKAPGEIYFMVLFCFALVETDVYWSRYRRQTIGEFWILNMSKTWWPQVLALCILMVLWNPSFRSGQETFEISHSQFKSSPWISINWNWDSHYCLIYRSSQIVHQRVQFKPPLEGLWDVGVLRRQRKPFQMHEGCWKDDGQFWHFIQCWKERPGQTIQKQCYGF